MADETRAKDATIPPSDTTRTEQLQRAVRDEIEQQRQLLNKLHRKLN